MAKAKATKSAPKAAAKSAKKVIDKKPAAKKAAAPKKAVGKKQPVAPKKVVVEKISKQQLDLCLILDCTGSMYSWIKRSKDTLYAIIEEVRKSNEGLKVKVGFVAYRDVQDGKLRFDVTEFTDDIELVKNNIDKQQATGGGDFPEDVQGGFNKALKLKWSSDSVKMAFHIADAPGHGKEICDFGDNHPFGSPDGFKIQDQMREFAKREIGFTFVKVNDSCDKMIKVMQENYDPSGRTMNVTDLSTACATLS